MRIQILIFVIIVFFNACQDNQENKGFTIKGNIKGLEDGTTYLMKYNKDGKFTKIDTSEIKDGKFQFEGKLKQPGILFINLHGKPAIEIYAENSDITIKGKRDSLDNVMVSGSQVHEQYDYFKDQIKALEEQQQELYPLFSEAKKNDNKKELNRLDSLYDAIEDDKIKIIKQYIADNPKTPVSLYAIRKHLVYYLDGKELEAQLSELDTSLHKFDTYKELAGRVDVLSKCAIGKKAPNFTLEDSTGKPVSLNDFRGNYLLLDFWASWCGPCRRENPNVVRMYKKYNDKGFEVLGVSLDSKRDKWLKAIEEDNLTWTHVSELKGWDSKAGKLYGVMSIPHTLLINKEGIIIDKNLKGKDLKEKLMELME